MYRFFISLIFCLLFVQNTFSSEIEAISNNTKQNIDNLSLQLKYLVQDHQDNKKEINNILNLYYQHHEKIQAFEIVYKNKYIYSSYKNDSTIIINDDSLFFDIKENLETYEKDILDNKNNSLGKLIVYFKKEIDFTPEELAYLKNKKIIRIQNDSDLAPYNFNENAIAKGYSIDYMNLIANKLAIQVDYQNVIWNEAMNMLENNQLDLMVNVLKSKEREDRFLFSDIPYRLSTVAMVSRISEKEYNSFSELDGKTIALVKGYYTYEKVKRDFPKINIYSTNNSLETITAVSLKKADLTYGIRDVLEYNINKNFISNLKITESIENENNFGFYFAYNKENSVLKSIISKAEKLISKNEIEKLNNKWFNKLQSLENNSKNFLFTQEEISYLGKKKNITMCVDPNFLPYEEITEKGNYSGIISDIINQLNKNTNIKFQLNITTSWEESYELVKNKRCDILPFTLQTKSREEYFNFTQPYLNFPIVIATKDSESFINSLKEIQNKKIALIKNFALIEIIKYSYPNIQIIEVRNAKEGLEKASSKDAYAYIDSMPTVAYIKQKYNIQDIKISGKISDEFLVRIAVRNDEMILQNILNKAINSLKEEDKERIVNKWLTLVKEKQFNTKVFIQIVILIIIIFVSIITALIYRSNIKLNALNKELRKLSQTDKLTSLYNRVKLDFILEKEIKFSQRYNSALTLAIVDIDLFKNINDTYGHTIGDIILKEFANILSKNIRETDYVGRWGGEEFLLIFTHTQSQNAQIIAENLRKIIEQYDFSNKIKLTASFGIYECKDQNPTKCLSKADKALYEAKNSSRNCVRVFIDKQN
ncbi:BvgS-like domain-containing diguanylate cyclase [Arcobacter acticola]|uniref:diguanylate cyclase n=1 Tax=Arcobacter acticola TaxID=1849015 RepID=A0A6M8EI13_9BACT|nr:transporter substrate-binding domain-containing protein [Arcobacter acticola]QKE27559.1 BvgS-like domain-containing diguanylate cyclase [Arcobacter acticola]